MVNLQDNALGRAHALQLLVFGDNQVVRLGQHEFKTSQYGNDLRRGHFFARVHVFDEEGGGAFRRIALPEPNVNWEPRANIGISREKGEACEPLQNRALSRRARPHHGHARRFPSFKGVF